MRMLLSTLVLGVLLASSLGVQAATHDIEGCITVYDTREDGAAGYVPLAHVPVRVWHSLTALGLTTWWSKDDTTDSSGCWSVTKSGLTIPANTDVFVDFEFKDSDFQVYGDDGTYVLYTETHSLSGDGDDADYGTIRANPTTSDAGAAMLLWLTAQEGKERYESLTGNSWTSEFPRLKIKYPYDGDNSVGGAGGIFITENARDNRGCFFHETGHFIAGNDANSSGSGDGYCNDSPWTSWPFSEVPFLYREEDPSDCFWDASGFEHESTAAKEAFANFIGGLFAGNTCNEDYEWNPDRAHRVRNVRQALCDLVDGAGESSAYLHEVGDPGLITDVTGGPTLYEDLGMDGSDVYATDGVSVYTISLTDGSVSTFLGLGDLPGGFAFRQPRREGDLFCMAYYNREVVCLDLSRIDTATGLHPQATATAPLGTGTVVDLALAGGELYLLEVDDSTMAFAVHRSPAIAGSGTWSWTEIVSGTYVSDWEEPTAIVVDDSRHELFLARMDEIQSCSLTSSAASCSMGLTTFAGGTYAGYHRAAPLDSYFYQIGALALVNDELFITDYFGVSRLNLASPARVRQFIGPGFDSVVLNNLSRRGLAVNGAPGEIPRFATDGTRSIFEGRILQWDEQRDEDDDWRRILVDDSVPVARRIYCGSDDVTADIAAVIHAYDGISFHAGATEVFDNIVANSTLTSSRADEVLELNWITSSAYGECEDYDRGEYAIADPDWWYPEDEDEDQSNDQGDPEVVGGESEDYADQDSSASDLLAPPVALDAG